MRAEATLKIPAGRKIDDIFSSLFAVPYGNLKEIAIRFIMSCNSHLGLVD